MQFFSLVLFYSFFVIVITQLGIEPKFIVSESDTPSLLVFELFFKKIRVYKRNFDLIGCFIRMTLRLIIPFCFSEAIRIEVGTSHRLIALTQYRLPVDRVEILICPVEMR